jgi:hypothetical protein
MEDDSIPLTRLENDSRKTEASKSVAPPPVCSTLYIVGWTSIGLVVFGALLGLMYVCGRFLVCSDILECKDSYDTTYFRTGFVFLLICFFAIMIVFYSCVIICFTIGHCCRHPGSCVCCSSYDEQENKEAHPPSVPSVYV